MTTCAGAKRTPQRKNAPKPPAWPAPLPGHGASGHPPVYRDGHGQYPLASLIVGVLFSLIRGYTAPCPALCRTKVVNDSAVGPNSPSPFTKKQAKRDAGSLAAAGDSLCLLFSLRNMEFRAIILLNLHSGLCWLFLLCRSERMRQQWVRQNYGQFVIQNLISQSTKAGQVIKNTVPPMRTAYGTFCVFQIYRNMIRNNRNSI